MIHLPHTRQTRYISGKAALNIPSRTGTGDWHFSDTFLTPRNSNPTRLFLVGEGCATNLNPYYGKKGIADRSASLRAAGVHFEGRVWSASHARAIVDWVTVLAIEQRDFSAVRIDDWMPRRSDKRKVVALIEAGMPKMPAEVAQKLKSWTSKIMD